jgi:hypothetical protein
MAFAAPCSQDTAVTVTGTPATDNCTVGVTATNPSNALSFLSDPNALIAGGTATSPNFSYVTTITDDRAGTAGWRLQASYTAVSFPTGGGTVSPTLTTVTGTTGTPTITGGNCVAPTDSLPLAGPLTGTPQTYLTMDPGTTVINCAEHFTTNGTINFGAVTAPAGLYTGNITLTMLNSAA